MKSLDHCLLGLIEQGDCSGYDIRKILTETPMQRYSDSPGSIYPALRRLAERKLVVPTQDRSSRRGRTSYRVTAKGRAALRKWLRSPVTHDEIATQLDAVMLRLAFLHLIGGASALRKFLRALSTAANAVAKTVSEYIDTATADYPDGARLALEAGLDTYVSLARWAEESSKRIARRKRR
jgi:DNA-binding PadR family transcriptional regulator